MKNSLISKLTKAVVLFALVAGLSACKSSESVSEAAANDNSERTEETASTDTEMSAAEMEALYWARQDSARMNFTQADAKFMTGMIAHHAQALIMSRLAPENNASREIQTLAARIINAQKDEIRSMQTWNGHAESPQFVSFSPNGKQFVSTDNSGRVIVWDIGKLVGDE